MEFRYGPPDSGGEGITLHDRSPQVNTRERPDSQPDLTKIESPRQPSHATGGPKERGNLQRPTKNRTKDTTNMSPGTIWKWGRVQGNSKSTRWGGETIKRRNSITDERLANEAVRNTKKKNRGARTPLELRRPKVQLRLAEPPRSFPRTCAGTSRKKGQLRPQHRASGKKLDGAVSSSVGGGVGPT